MSCGYAKYIIYYIVKNYIQYIYMYTPKYTEYICSIYVYIYRHKYTVQVYIYMYTYSMYVCVVAML